MWIYNLSVIIILVIQFCFYFVREWQSESVSDKSEIRKNSGFRWIRQYIPTYYNKILWKRFLDCHPTLFCYLLVEEFFKDFCCFFRIKMEMKGIPLDSRSQDIYHQNYRSENEGWSGNFFGRIQYIWYPTRYLAQPDIYPNPMTENS